MSIILLTVSLHSPPLNIVCLQLSFIPLAPTRISSLLVSLLLLKCLSVSLEHVPSGQGFLWFSALCLAPSLVSGVGGVSGGRVGQVFVG